MQKKDRWEEIEKGKEEDYFLKKHRKWLEKKRGGSADKTGEKGAGEELACPRCSKPLSEDLWKTFKVFRCDTCGGGWLDEESLKEISSALD